MRKILLPFIILFLVSCTKNSMTKNDFDRAQLLYSSNCSSCHGVKGYGDGIASASFNPPPRNFHLPTEKWVNGKSMEGIQKTLTEGVMPNMWAYHGDKKDIPILAKYVMFLGNSE